MLKTINGLVVFKKLKIVNGRHMTTDKKKTIGHLSDSGDQKRLQAIHTKIMTPWARL